MISDFFQWDALGSFIEKVGLSMTIWFVTIFVVYRLIMVFGVKVWDRFGPVIDAHFELIISMKDNLAKQTQLMQETNTSLKKNFEEEVELLKENISVARNNNEMLKVAASENRVCEYLRSQNGNKR